MKKMINSLAACAALFMAWGAMAQPADTCFSEQQPGNTSGNSSYFDVTVEGVTYDGWCLDGTKRIGTSGSYTGFRVDLTTADILNIDRILWILNQHYPGKNSSSGVFVFGDVQVAIWTLLGTANGGGDPGYNLARVDEILVAAALYGGGFTPIAGQISAFALYPFAIGCPGGTAPTAPIQPILIEIPVEGPTPPSENPGTGTPGYWMNHPGAWPVASITIGCVSYTKLDAIALMKAPVKKDKRLIMIPQLISAKLNVLIGNDGSCIAEVIAAAEAWLCANPNPVAGGSAAWAIGAPLASMLDDYNNGRLCAPHRDTISGPSSKAKPKRANRR